MRWTKVLAFVVVLAAVFANILPGLERAVFPTNDTGLESQSLTSSNSPKFFKEYKSMEEMLSSSYFVNPNRAENVMISVKGSESQYQIMSYSSEKAKKKIIIQETKLGKRQKAQVLDVPISKCQYSHSKDTTFAIKKSTSLSNLFAELHGLRKWFDYSFNLLDLVKLVIPSAVIDGAGQLVRALNVTTGFSVGLEESREEARSHSFGGSIICSTGDSGVVQMFHSLRFSYYPESQSRWLVYHSGNWGNPPTLVEEGPWEPAFSSKAFPQYGIIYYNNSFGAEYACVNKQEYLKCDDVIPLNIYDPQFDPGEGLSYALEKRKRTTRLF